MTYLIEPTSDGQDLVLTGSWSPAARQILLDGRADGLVVNYARGYVPGTIDFLSGLPIRRLKIIDRSLNELGPVYSLASTLEVLHIQSDPRAVIELDRLPVLRNLAVAWPQVQGSIRYASNVKELSLPSYSERDLQPLESLTSLENLTFKERPKLHSVDGITELPWLAHLGIHLARDFENLSSLERAASPTIRSLRLTSCRKLKIIDAVAACPSLRFFELSESGDISSVAALAGLVDLEHLYLFGSTKVVDGNLQQIANLPRLKDFRMMNRREYKPSVNEVKETLSQRN